MEFDFFAGGDANRRQPRVLIVDDDPAALKFLSDRCEKMGVAVQTDQRAAGADHWRGRRGRMP